jgi:hypothetical protein
MDNGLPANRIIPLKPEKKSAPRLPAPHYAFAYYAKHHALGPMLIPATQHLFIGFNRSEIRNRISRNPLVPDFIQSL